MKELNAIPEDLARENAAFTRELLGDVLSDREAAARGDAAFHESAGELSLQLALFLTALEASRGEVVRMFEQAAAHLAPALALRRPPVEGEHRSPWQGEQWIDVVACWGDAAAIRAVAGLRPWQYRSPARPEHDALALYLGVLLRRLGGAPTDGDALRSVVAACDSGAATREDRLFLRPAASGLIAVEAADADGWNYALAQILSAHAQEAREGDLMRLADGFLSVRALLLAKLGLERGLTLRARSPYLRVDLLGPDGRA